MLLFDRAAPRGSRLLPVGPNPPGSPLKTWATVDPTGVRRIVVINKDLKNTWDVVLHVPNATGRARIERLAAPSSRSSQGVTFGGQTYGASTRDGVLRGRRSPEPVVGGPDLRVKMPPASAALVTVPQSR